MTTVTEPWLYPIKPADLKKNHAHDYVLEPGAETRQKLAETLGILGIRKLRMVGQLRPAGKTDWQFSGQIGATVVQPCVVTLDPVTTRIDEPVERSFVKDWVTPDTGSEMEMPEDDTTDALAEIIDLGQIMAEALALALPAYPRSQGADPVEFNYTEPGKTALNEETAKPFAGLSALRDRLGKTDPEEL